MGARKISSNPTDLLFGLRSLAGLFAMTRPVAQIRASRELAGFVRLHFLFAAYRAGLLGALADGPRSREAIAAELKVERMDLLDPMLELGVALRELSKRRGQYRLRGMFARALADPEADALAAMIEEFVTYHGSVYRHWPERLRGEPLGDYLKETGPLIARSSRLLEPFLSRLVQSLVRGDRVLTLLEVGCGSGVYLRYAAVANPRVTGVGIDLREEVAARARENLKQWGFPSRFTILHADVRSLPPEARGPFDLVTLYNNVYYFEVGERVNLFRSLRDVLRPGGAFALASLMRGPTALAQDFDLVLRSTLGCAALPSPGELRAQLREAGFENIRAVRLMPNEPFYAIVSR